MSEQILCLSYFDQIIGPNLFYCSEEYDEESPDYPDLGRILEFNDEEGTFIFAFRKYQTVNHLFYIDSSYARGGKELLMISYLLRSSFFKNEITDVFKYLESKSIYLEQASKELSRLEELTDILHSRERSENKKGRFDLASKQFKSEFLKIFEKYQKKLSPISTAEVPGIQKPNKKKIFIFGARGTGKTTFLKSIEAIQFHNQTNNDLPTMIYEVVIDNIEIMSYDCVDQDFVCERCKNYGSCLKNSQGYIFLIDASKKSTLDNAKERYQRIVNSCSELENQTTPVLIIGNKFNGKEEISPDEIYHEFDLAEARNCGIRIQYYAINIAKENTKIMDALRWLIHQMI